MPVTGWNERTEPTVDLSAGLGPLLNVEVPCSGAGLALSVLVVPSSWTPQQEDMNACNVYVEIDMLKLGTDRRRKTYRFFLLAL